MIDVDELSVKLMESHDVAPGEDMRHCIQDSMVLGVVDQHTEDLAFDIEERNSGCVEVA